jgi:hypothetical protein
MIIEELVKRTCEGLCRFADVEVKSFDDTREHRPFKQKS